MRIAIVGAGAMGSIFGSRLAEAGEDVLLVDVSTNLVEKINTNGVSVEPKDGTTTKTGLFAASPLEDRTPTVSVNAYPPGGMVNSTSSPGVTDIASEIGARRPPIGSA